MKGLILKDIYTSIKCLRSYFVIMALFIAAPFISEDVFFCAFYPCLICGMFPQSLISYDERSKWESYCGTLPIRKSDVVSAKYIVSLIMIAFTLIVSAIAHGIRLFVTDAFGWTTYWIMLASIVVLGCIVIAIQLPFVFKYGTEKGRIAYWGMVIVASAGSVLLGTLFDDQNQPQISLETIIPVLCLVSIGIYALSWLLSIKFYHEREIA